MKTLACILMVFACSWSCSKSGTVSDTGDNRDVSVTNPGPENTGDRELDSYPPEPSVVVTRKRKAVGSFRIDEYEDNELFGSSFYRNGVLTKSIGYNPRTKKKESETKYFYKKNGELDHSRSRGPYASKDMDLEADHSEADFKVWRDFLESRDILFPLADIVYNDVSDLSNIFSIAENYTDFKTETQTDGNRKVIKLIGFNKTSRFNNSPISLLTGDGDFIHIQNYALTLERSFPVKEIYDTNKGEFTKTYSYKDGKLTRVAYRFTNLENKTNTLTKRFQYHRLTDRGN